MVMTFNLRAALVLIALALPLAAQVTVGGKVVDNAGNGVPDLKVSLTNQATKVEKEIRTSPDGAYSLATDPGTYAVAIEKPGRGLFAVRDIELAAGQNRTVNFELSAHVENRNFTYMFYGFVAAWLLLVIYVVTLVAREGGLRRQIESLKQMVESERR
jgi:CcmD family protein